MVGFWLRGMHDITDADSFHLALRITSETEQAGDPTTSPDWYLLRREATLRGFFESTVSGRGVGLLREYGDG